MSSSLKPSKHTFLVRIVLPVTLVLASLSRISVVSLAYGLHLLLCPFLPGPEDETERVSWWTRRFIQVRGCWLSTIGNRLSIWFALRPTALRYKVIHSDDWLLVIGYRFDRH